MAVALSGRALPWACKAVKASRRFAAWPAARRGLSTSREPILLCPGPVRVTDAVLASLSRQCVPHREAEFRDVYRRCQEGAVDLLGGRPGEHFAAWTTGSGTCAVEAVVSSYLASRRTLLICQGSFGERWREVCRTWGVPLSVLEVGGGERLDVQRVRAACLEAEAETVFVVHHETSTGVLNDLGMLNAACQDLPGQGPDMVVDAVSSFGCEEIDLAELSRVSFVMAGANKGLEAPPGTCLVAGRVEAFESLVGDSAPAPRSFYLDLGRIYKYAKIAETSTTPAVNTFFSTLLALEELKAETLVARRARMLQLTRRARERMVQLGYERVLPASFAEADMSCYLTNFFYPGMTSASAPNKTLADAFHAVMEAEGIFLYRGKDGLQDRSFQVCTMGHVADADLDLFLERAADLARARNAAGAYAGDGAVQATAA